MVRPSPRSGRSAGPRAGLRGPRTRSGGRPGGRPRSWLLTAATVPVLGFLILPSLVVFPMALTPRRYIEFPPSGVSLSAFRDLAADRTWRAAGLTSVKVAVVAVVFAVLLGTCAALALHRQRFTGRNAVVGLLLAPLLAPVIVLAFADYQFFARVRLIGSVWSTGLAHGVLATPLVFIAVTTSLAGLDPALVRSAQSLGAGWLATFWNVTWPAVRPGVAAGAVFGFALSFDEAVVALFLAGPETTTLPVKMFNAIQFELTPKVAAASVLLVLIATAVLVVQAALLRHRRAEVPPA
jgi:ABC-type spermidine/putrescine transport system permease subunit II